MSNKNGIIRFLVPLDVSQRGKSSASVAASEPMSELKAAALEDFSSVEFLAKTKREQTAIRAAKTQRDRLAVREGLVFK